MQKKNIYYFMIFSYCKHALRVNFSKIDSRRSRSLRCTVPTLSVHRQHFCSSKTFCFRKKNICSSKKTSVFFNFRIFTGLWLKLWPKYLFHMCFSRFKMPPYNKRLNNAFSEDEMKFIIFKYGETQSITIAIRTFGSMFHPKHPRLAH